MNSIDPTNSSALQANNAEKKAMQILENCMSENSVSSQDLDDLKSGKIKPEDAKDNIKCATQCMLVKFGFMDDKGKLLNDKIVEFFPDAAFKTKMESALAACGNIVGANPCDTAFQITNCFHDQAVLNL